MKGIETVNISSSLVLAIWTFIVHITYTLYNLNIVWHLQELNKLA